MARRLSLLLITLGFFLEQASATNVPALDTLHRAFSAHDQRIEQDRASWQVAYQQALDLAQSDRPERALPAFEALLEILAEQEIPFSQVYVRYFTLAEQLYQRPNTINFLQDLATRHPTPWVLGALRETQALVEARVQFHALLERLQAQSNLPVLASNLQTLNLLFWPYGTVGEAEEKAVMEDELVAGLSKGIDRSGIDRLARWRYQRQADSISLDLNGRQTALEQALQTGNREAIIVAFSHYLADLIASHRLEDGVNWARSRMKKGDASLALPMLADVLDTASGNQHRFSEALATIRVLRQRAPDSLLLTITESTLRFFTPIQGYRQADETLADFGERQMHDTRIQRAIRFHRDMLANWAKLPGRIKRNTFTALPAVEVTAPRIGHSSFPGDTIIYEGGSSRLRNGLAPSECTQPTGITPVVRIIPRLPSLPKPNPKANNAATAPQLNKQLASEAQLAELKSTGGKLMAGHQPDKPIHDLKRLLAEYGGRPSDWRKISSKSYTAVDGTRFEIHAYWNTVTKQLVEPKTIVIRTP
ncbi:hypothetical protein [Paludibacterium paludis]|uniref:Tetratricopeptide repeat protein n=1 Tax=Paludibacterium paludis TaxID=1225769 RepID=A0A918U9K9_9NEIS|nr:hypothetical protein [Paludibacterium paludis]GGY12424.1 hypothetical protein GCM10011289_14490 [Paludibacterium paludis]